MDGVVLLDVERVLLFDSEYSDTVWQVPSDDHVPHRRRNTLHVSHGVAVWQQFTQLRLLCAAARRGKRDIAQLGRARHFASNRKTQQETHRLISFQRREATTSRLRRLDHKLHVQSKAVQRQSLHVSILLVRPLLLSVQLGHRRQRKSASFARRRSRWRAQRAHHGDVCRHSEQAQLGDHPTRCQHSHLEQHRRSVQEYAEQHSGNARHRHEDKCGEELLQPVQRLAVHVQRLQCERRRHVDLSDTRQALVRLHALDQLYLLAG